MAIVRVSLAIVLCLGLTLAAMPAGGSAAGPGTTLRVDLVDAPDLQKEYIHLLPQVDISPDGRWLVYVKDGSVYLFDRVQRRTELITKRADGSPDRSAVHPRISEDGQTIAFVTQYQYVTEGGIGSNNDVYIYRRATREFEWVTYNRDGGQENTAVWAAEPALTSDGRYLAFAGDAERMVPDDDNGCVDEHALPSCSDIFLRDLQTKSIERISRGWPGFENRHDLQGLALFATQPAISDDGRAVAFRAMVAGLSPPGIPVAPSSWIFLRDRSTNTTELISKTSAGLPAGSSLAPSISADGRYVAFVSWDPGIVANDDNETYDVFLKDRVSGTTTRVSTDSSGGEAQGASIWPTLSGNGRFLVFTSWAGDLVPGDSNGRADIFIKDLQSGVIERLSVSNAGDQGNSHSTFSAVSRDGRFVSFFSEADNLTHDDPDIRPDLYLRDRGAG